jgi:hypothetical protein
MSRRCLVDVVGRDGPHKIVDSKRRVELKKYTLAERSVSPVNQSWVVQGGRIT